MEAMGPSYGAGYGIAQWGSVGQDVGLHGGYRAVLWGSAMGQDMGLWGRMWGYGAGYGAMGQGCGATGQLWVPLWGSGTKGRSSDPVDVTDQ